jgi:hypothetical protein
MRKYVNSEASQHEMKLIQMGAEVEQINSKMCYVRFKVYHIDVEYVYNINAKNKYFLERIKPYPLPIKEYETESDLINIIRIDIKQFENACKSKNIDTFIKINRELNTAIKRFEDLFLYYNVPKVEGEIIMQKINEIQEEIRKTQKLSQRVFFDKNPDNL